MTWRAELGPQQRGGTGMGREGGTQSEASKQGWEGCATGDELPVMQGMSGRADTHTLGTLHKQFLDAKGFCVPQSLHLQRGLDGGQDVGQAIRRGKTPAVSTVPAHRLNPKCLWCADTMRPAAGPGPQGPCQELCPPQFQRVTPRRLSPALSDLMRPGRCRCDLVVSLMAGNVGRT